MTAVEWFAEELYKKVEMKGDGKVFDELLEQAKEMDKEHKKFIFECGRNFQLTGEGTFEEVYNETFKSE